MLWDGAYKRSHTANQERVSHLPVHDHIPINMLNASLCKTFSSFLGWVEYTGEKNESLVGQCLHNITVNYKLLAYLSSLLISSILSTENLSIASTSN